MVWPPPASTTEAGGGVSLLEKFLWASLREGRISISFRRLRTAELCESCAAKGF